MKLLAPIYKPKWIKEGKLLLKGSKKFLNYKRDLLEKDRIAEINSRRTDLKKALKAWDKDAVTETSKQLHSTCEKSLRHYKQPDWLAENLEVFWVAIVIALGIRAYFLQPFRIPTGSMQPTLNGIIAKSDPELHKPWLGKRTFDYLAQGKRYFDITAKKNLEVKNITNSNFFIFTRTKIHFTDGSSVSIPAPLNETLQIDTIKKNVQVIQLGKNNLKFTGSFEKGDPIFRGTLVTGDLVLVDKISYHFRKPKRSESFVFTTIGIERIHGGRFRDQNAGSHYIKRLAGIPGDQLAVTEPHLLIDGKIAQEPLFQKIMNRKTLNKNESYHGYTNTVNNYLKQGDPITLNNTGHPNTHEYFALGDNSRHSSDSRDWGTVKQHNLVGPAFFALWPFASGHWGLIE